MDLVTEFAAAFHLTHLLPITPRIVSAVDRHGEFMHVSEVAPVNGLRCVTMSWDGGKHHASWLYNGRWVPTSNAPAPAPTIAPERTYTLEEIIA